MPRNRKAKPLRMWMLKFKEDPTPQGLRGSAYLTRRGLIYQEFGDSENWAGMKDIYKIVRVTVREEF